MQQPWNEWNTSFFRKYFTEKADRVVSTASWFVLHGFKVSGWSVSKWISDWKSSYQQCSKRLKLPLLWQTRSFWFLWGKINSFTRRSLQNYVTRASMTKNALRKRHKNWKQKYPWGNRESILSLNKVFPGFANACNNSQLSPLYPFPYVTLGHFCGSWYRVYSNSGL